MDLKKWLPLCWSSLIAVTLSGCDVTQDMAVEKGKDMVASALKDPASATFGKVYMVETKTVGDTHYGYLCGEVNSKNSFGGFTGFRRFVANFNYSKGGALEASYVTLEEGSSAKLNRAGISYFQEIYWYGKCEPAPPATVAAQNEGPATSEPAKPAASPGGVARQDKKARTPVPAAKVSSSPSPAPSKVSGWSVQVASVADSGKAKSMRDELTESGTPSYVVALGGITRVFSGPYETREAAEAARESLLKSRRLQGIVVRVQN